MSLKSWAEQEVQFAIDSLSKSEDKDIEYNIMCLKSALKVFNSLVDDGHSGMSIQITKAMLNRLIDGKPLVPIYESTDEWSLVRTDDTGVSHYQSIRMSSLFKNVNLDGDVNYLDIDRFICYDLQRYNEGIIVPYHNRFINEYMETLYPLHFPYYGDKYKVFVEEFLVDSRNGDFDTFEIIKMVDDTNNTVEIHRYFKEVDSQWVEISKEEYEDRKYKLNNS